MVTYRLVVIYNAFYFDFVLSIKMFVHIMSRLLEQTRVARS